MARGRGGTQGPRPTAALRPVGERIEKEGSRGRDQREKGFLLERRQGIVRTGPHRACIRGGRETESASIKNPCPLGVNPPAARVH